MTDAGMQWKAHLPALFDEIMKKEGTSILRIPLQIVKDILAQVAARAIELDDPELNELMLRLALYEQGDPYSESFQPEAIREQRARRSL